MVADDAPAGFYNQPCRGVCTESGSDLTCELETFCPNGPATATAVTTYASSTHDVSIWGRCHDLTNLIEFCCVFDDTSDVITRVELNGTPSPDEGLMFVDALDTPSEENLEPWDDDAVTGIIRGNAGGDLIYGSDYAGTGYTENLFGQDGADAMSGNAGDDKLSGGDGSDIIQAGPGADLIWAGDGNDHSDGQGGNDTICDASGYDYCADDQQTLMEGGAGDDQLWYEESENPNVPCPGILLDPNSNAGDQDVRDQCGDNSNFPPTELPAGCEAYTTVKPWQCEDAN